MALRRTALRCSQYLSRTTVVRAPLAANAPQQLRAIWGHRGYARLGKPSRTLNVNPKFVLPDEYTEEVFKALAGNPEIMQALHNVIEILDKRGIKLDREPNVAEMWQIVKDKEVIDSIKTLSKIAKSKGVDLGHILKALPWSKANSAWAESGSPDPSMTQEAIEHRLKSIQEILRRPDPGTQKPKQTQPTLEKDETHQYMSAEDRLSLDDFKKDLRDMWRPGEEKDFMTRLNKLRGEKGDDWADAEIYDLWIDEWSRKVKELKAKT